MVSCCSNKLRLHIWLSSSTCEVNRLSLSKSITMPAKRPVKSGNDMQTPPSKKGRQGAAASDDAATPSQSPSQQGSSKGPRVISVPSCWHPSQFQIKEAIVAFSALLLLLHVIEASRQQHCSRMAATRRKCKKHSTESFCCRLGCL